MPSIMSIWQHAKTRVCYIRETIPADVRDAAKGRKTYKRSLRTTKHRDAQLAMQDARVVFHAWIATLRTGPITLTEMQAHALTGVWYRKHLEEWEQNPGSPEDWEATLYAMPSCESDSDADRVEFMRPIVNTLLADQELSITDESRSMLTRHLFLRVLGLAGGTMQRRAVGDFSRDPALDEFPTWVHPRTALVNASAPRGPAVTFEDMLGRWTKAATRAPGTVKSYARILSDFEAAILKSRGHRDPAQVETDDVTQWRDALVAGGLKRKTVQSRYLAAVSAIYSKSQGKGTGRLTVNPVDGARFDGRVFSDSEKVRSYSTNELRAILEAARKETHPERRWLPWLMAYTGARYAEAAQCIASDIKEAHGITHLDINSDGAWKRLKGKPNTETAAARTVPLHAHLLAEGFAEYVAGLAPDAFLFPRVRPRDGGGSRFGRPENSLRDWLNTFAPTPEGSKTRTSPTHSFRHAFEDMLREATPDTELRLDIQGRTDGSSARGYGEGHLLQKKAEAIRCIPDLC